MLSKIKSDIVSVSSAAGLLPDATPSNDVNLIYIENGTQLSATNGSTDNLTQVSQVELDLILGKTIANPSAVGADLGLPGLGLKVNPGSTINGSVGWTFDVGVGFTANTAYVVTGNSGNNGSPLNLTVRLHPRRRVWCARHHGVPGGAAHRKGRAEPYRIDGHHRSGRRRRAAQVRR